MRCIPVNTPCDHFTNAIKSYMFHTEFEYFFLLNCKKATLARRTDNHRESISIRITFNLNWPALRCIPSNCTNIPTGNKIFFSRFNPITANKSNQLKWIIWDVSGYCEIHKKSAIVDYVYSQSVGCFTSTRDIWHLFYAHSCPVCRVK